MSLEGSLDSLQGGRGGSVMMAGGSSDDNSTPQASGAAAYTKSCNACQSRVHEMMQAAAVEILLTHSPPPRDGFDQEHAQPEPLDVVIQRTFEILTHGVREYIDKMSDEARQINKDSLHAVQFDYGGRIERTRRGSDVALQQQGVAMEAAKTMAVARRAKEIMETLASDDGKDQLLLESQEQIVNLTRNVDLQSKRARAAEDELSKAKKANEASAVEIAQLRSSAALLQNQIHEANAAADEATALAASNEKEAAEASERASAAEHAVATARSELSVAEAARDKVSSQLLEASREMTRILSVHEAEREQLLRRLEEAMRGHIEAMEAAQRAAAERGIVLPPPPPPPPPPKPAVDEKAADALALAMALEIRALEISLEAAQEDHETRLHAAHTALAGVNGALSETSAELAEAKGVAVRAQLRTEDAEAEAERLRSVNADLEATSAEVQADMDRQLAAACADATRAAKLEADECKRQVGQLARRLQDELARVKGESRRSALDEQWASLARTEALRAALATADEQLKSDHAELARWRQRYESALVRMREVEARDHDATSAKKRVQELEAEVDECRRSIEEALQCATDYEDKAVTLGERLGMLVSKHREARETLAETRAVLGSTAKQMLSLQTAAAHERASLVRAALASLEHLHAHLATYLAPGVPHFRPSYSDGGVDSGAGGNSADGVLLPFSSPEWWRVYGAAARSQREGSGGQRPSSSSPRGVPVHARHHPSVRRAAWHEIRGPEERASRTIGALTARSMPARPRDGGSGDGSASARATSETAAPNARQTDKGGQAMLDETLALAADEMAAHGPLPPLPRSAPWTAPSPGSMRVTRLSSAGPVAQRGSSARSR